MRFMVILKANKDSESGTPPKWESVEAMMGFNEEMHDEVAAKSAKRS